MPEHVGTVTFMTRRWPIFAFPFVLLVLAPILYLSSHPAGSINTSPTQVFIDSPAPHSAVSQHPLRIAFYTTGLGAGYFRFPLDLFESAAANFCVNQSIIHTDYYVFSNQQAPVDATSKNIHIIPTEKRGWPFDSQDRFLWIHDHALKHPNYDYILWMDADQLFERPICFDLLGELVAVAHPHLFDGVEHSFPYEDRPESKAYVPAINGRTQPYFSAH